MAFVVTEACIKCKYTDCVEVCPVDCFYEGPEFLVIHPDECIDCALCEPECPIDAILSEDELPEDQIDFIEINAKLADVYPNISEAKEPLPDADKYKDLANLPTREEMIAKFASMLSQPMTVLVGTLSGTITKLAGTLTSLKEQKQ